MNAFRVMLLAVAALVCGCEDETTIIREPASTTTTPADPTAFAFRTDPRDAYVKVDRMGGPATTTALLMPGGAGGARRQQANLTEPNQDAQYAQEYISTLRTLHFELAPVLAQLGLATCGVVPAGATSPTSPPTDVSKCVGQALGVGNVIPDVLELDTRLPSAYPNGRDADDQVVDILLAIALLNLTDSSARCFGGPCTLRTIAALPLNPGASNPPPLSTFPYLNNQALAPPPPADP